jgi:predicted DNA-binding transcriptional regulator AlpA
MSHVEIPPSAAKREEPLLIRANELAGILNVSRRTLWRLKSAGALPRPMRLGAAIRWRFEEIKQWIAAGCPTPANRENGRTKNSRS